MPQIFYQSTNTFAKVSIFSALFVVLALLGVWIEVNRSPYVTRVGMVREQPVPFSHDHHVRGLGIDCRYCHTSVEESAFAGIPPTYTCMSCHSQIWTQSPLLEPVRASLRDDRPLRWTRVHDLPDYVYFHHGVHVKKGIGCSSCHGRVDRMPIMWKDQPLTMEWCLECHRHPERHIRPRDEVFNMEWQAPADQEDRGRKLLREYKVEMTTDTRTNRLTNCSTCHR